ncbi:MAG TPA: DEAD/DEAH box helicase [Bacilli bacterium]
MNAMTKPKIAVHCEWVNDKGFLLYGRISGRHAVNIFELKNKLFGWHARSYYGTMLEIVEEKGRQRILLDPLMALDYFAGSGPLLHAALEWDETAAMLREAAAFFYAALREGRFMPDMRRRRFDFPGWKMIVPEDQRATYERIVAEAKRLGAAYLKDWFDCALLRMIETEGEVRAAFGKIAARYPGVLRSAPALSEIGDDALRANAAEIAGVAGAVDAAGVAEAAGAVEVVDAAGVARATEAMNAAEEEWLMSIGWKIDLSPFRISLQLVEPRERDEWTLRLLLQDKNNEERLAVCDLDGLPPADAPTKADGADSSSLGASVGPSIGPEIPAEWNAFLPSAVARFVRGCLRTVPGLAQGTSAGRMKAVLDDEEAWRFLTEDSLHLAEAGYPVLLPSWWDTVKRTKPRLKAKIRSSVGSAGESLFGLQQIVQFDWKMAIGGLELSEAEFRELAASKRRFIFLRGQWIHLDPGYLRELQRKMKLVEKKGLSFRDVLELHLSGADAADAFSANGHDAITQIDEADAAEEVRMEVELNQHLAELVAQLQKTTQLPLFPAPENFHGTLRNYQIQGSSWMVFLHRYGLGGCLADDMGLGKTVQWIAYVLHLKRNGALDAPALLICPTSVLGNWQKELRRFAPNLKLYIHYGSNRRKGDAFAASVQGADVVLTTYTLSHLDEAELTAVRWGTLCLDEAQNIKNAYTKQAAAIRKLEANHRIALTGTPIENRLTELWSIFDFLNPHYLGSLNHFRATFVNPIEKTKNPKLIERVQKLIQPFLLRRVKKDPAIRLDLPEKNESKIYVSLTAEQATLYETILEDMFARLDRLPPMERRGLILAVLTRLKQVCDHPSLILKDTRTDASARVPRSNKIARLLEMVGELREEDDRCLIFTQFVEMGHMLVQFLEKRLGERVLFLHGGVPKTRRDRMIATFQDERQNDSGIFVLSLKAGGTGLNLTAANHVFHVDRWWNPAVEDQATDRAYRIGQKRDVQVHKFVSLGTLEERIDEMIERKQGLSRQIVGAGEHWITELSTSELRDIFALRREWIDESK